MKTLDKLNFLTAGIPLAAKDYKTGFETLSKLGLNGLELEFVHGVRISDTSKDFLKNDDRGFILTAHAPFYINLNSKEEEKVEASIQRIVETAAMAEHLGGYSITYHAAFYLKEDKETVFKKLIKTHEKIFKELEKQNVKIWVRPETTGKETQWGSIDEIIEMSKIFPNMLPCVDFSHIHARTGGKHNTYDEFSTIFEKIAKGLGDKALNNFHAHIAGIEYTLKGEKKHLNLEESDFNYKDLLKAFKAFNVKGAVVCESPNIENDCKLLRDYYISL